MATTIRNPEWRAEYDTTNYPFTDDATLTNGTQSILQGTFLDAQLYPIGGGERMFLSKAEITHERVTLYIGDNTTDELASTTFNLVSPPDVLEVVDAFGRPAGIIVSESVRLGVFQTWGTGEVNFVRDQTPFVASVCAPTPQIGLRGILLDDGSVMTGDIWLVGDDGVVLRYEEVTVPAKECGGDPEVHQVIRMDVVGDPLFRRRLCQTSDLFVTPRFIKQVTFSDGNQTYVATPNDKGELPITVNNNLAEDTVLRLRPTAEGILMEAMGTQLESVQ